MVLYKNWSIGGSARTIRQDGVVIYPSHPSIVDGNENTCEITLGGGGPTYWAVVDLGSVHRIQLVRIKAAMNWSTPGTVGISAGTDPTPSNQTYLGQMTFPGYTLAWRELSSDIMARYISMGGGWTFNTCEIQGIEILTTTTFTSSLDDYVVPPGTSFTVFGNVKDQYGNPMNGQIINIDIYKAGAIFTSTTATADINGDYSKVISTTGWSQDLYEVRAISDSITRSSTVNVTNVGNLDVDSIPQGAEIVIDGNPTGSFTPNFITGISSGNHNIVLRLPGYNDSTSILNFSPDETEVLRVQLRLLGSPQTIGNLFIESSPTNAQILIDGVDRNTTTSATFAGESTGSHNVRLTLAGYEDYTTRVPIVEGQTTTVSATLQPLTGPCPISTRYLGDIIYLQATPQNGTGSYYVEFRKNGIIIDSSRLGGLSNPVIDAPEDIQITRIYTLDNEDIRTALTGTINFEVFMSDSCPAPLGPKTCNVICTVNVGCIAPICNFTVT